MEDQSSDRHCQAPATGCQVTAGSTQGQHSSVPVSSNRRTILRTRAPSRDTGLYSHGWDSIPLEGACLRWPAGPHGSFVPAKTLLASGRVTRPAQISELGEQLLRASIIIDLEEERDIDRVQSALARRSLVLIDPFVGRQANFTPHGRPSHVQLVAVPTVCSRTGSLP